MALHMTQVDGSIAREDRVSTVVALLPTVVRSRILPLRHIRRSISLSSIRTAFASSDEAIVPRPQSEGNITPSDSMEPRDASGPLNVQESLQITSGIQSDMSLARKVDMRERFAQQGARLVGMSMAGNEMPSSSRTGDFERDAYIDGLAYLLRGLPEELTPHERDRLRLSMPVGLGDSQALVAEGAILQSQPRTSSLYRLTRAAVVNIIILFSVLLPYMLLMLQWLAALERRYKVSETVGQYSINVVNTVASQTVRMADAYRGQDAKVGRLVLSRLLWTVEEVTRGVSDGVDRGLSGVRTQHT